MLKKILFGLFRWLAILIVILVMLLAAPRMITAFYSSTRIFHVDQAPQRRVAIVFGAGLWRDGSPTPVLRDRVATAAALYFSGKVEKLLMSGDNSTANYNEPAAMLAYALDLGVPEEAIVLDYAGRRTYDTCYRAREIFGISQAILVTQQFHLPRAIYTCNALGIDAIGVSADLRVYRTRSLLLWNLRETPATLVALWETQISHPLPILGNPEPIFTE